MLSYVFSRVPTIISHLSVELSLLNSLSSPLKFLSLELSILLHISFHSPPLTRTLTCRFMLSDQAELKKSLAIETETSTAEFEKLKKQEDYLIRQYQDLRKNMAELMRLASEQQ
jgi:hypothetical protein